MPETVPEGSHGHVGSTVLQPSRWGGVLDERPHESLTPSASRPRVQDVRASVRAQSGCAVVARSSISPPTTLHDAHVGDFSAISQLSRPYPPLLEGQVTYASSFSTAAALVGQKYATVRRTTSGPPPVAGPSRPILRTAMAKSMPVCWQMPSFK